MAFPRHCHFPTGGLVLVWCFRAMSAAVGNFSLSNSDTTELEEAVLSLSESKVSLSNTELSALLVLAPLVLAAISAHAKVQLYPYVLPFIPALCSLRTATYYSGNYARIIAAPLVTSKECNFF